MNINVVLCTYNRCQSLAKALESAAALVLPEGDEYVVLVVDNNSRDRTREVVENFCQRYPGRFRYLFEPKQGKSHALNAGIRETRGDILAFLDDDVTVDSNWLGNLTAPLRSGEWAGAGGRILPDRAFSPPRWLALDKTYAKVPLVIFDLGSVAGPLHVAPFGTNMAFRREVFEKYGGFRVDLGPRPGSEIRSEDTEFVVRLFAGGEHLKYEPSALVYHEVPERRVTRKFYLRWWFDKARADVRAFGVPSEGAWKLGGVPLVYFRRLAAWMVRWMVAIEPSTRFEAKTKLYWLVGTILESYRHSADSKRRLEVEIARSSRLAEMPKTSPKTDC